MPKQYHIFFAGDEKYIKYIAVTISSIVKNANSNRNTIENEEFVFHILTDGVSEQTQNKIDNLALELSEIFTTKIQVHTFSSDDFQAFPAWRNSYLNYYRFFFLETLQKDVEKALYLDADIIVNCDIRELFAFDLEDKVLAANGSEQEITFQSLKNEEPYHYKGCYFNSGVLLINVPRWREHCVKEKSIEFLNNYLISMGDQDALNAVIRDYLVISYHWNMHSSVISNYIPSLADKHEKNDIINTIKNDTQVKIIHYASRKKPWASIGLVIHNNMPTMDNISSFIYWWHYAENCLAFKDDLLEIKNSKSYIKAVRKEQRVLNFINKGSFFKKLYILKLKWESIYTPIRRAIEKPYKVMRNRLRVKYKTKK